MSKIEKKSPLLNLQNFQVFLTDTVASSNYFRVSELSDTFTSGKNGFLIDKYVSVVFIYKYTKEI